jgi:hypothetical protein
VLIPIKKNTYISERNQRKKIDEVEKYYKNAPVYVLCKKMCVKISFFFLKMSSVEWALRYTLPKLNPPLTQTQVK